MTDTLHNLFNDAVSSSGYNSHRRMAGQLNWEEYGRKWSWLNLKYCPRIS
jgi:hypothetical protein